MEKRNGRVLPSVLLVLVTALQLAHSQNVIDCANLTQPDFGQLSLSDGVSVGSEAAYNCTEGFKLLGNGSRVCQQNGEWSGDEPMCLEILRIEFVRRSEDPTVVSEGTGRRLSVCVQLENEEVIQEGRNETVVVRLRNGTATTRHSGFFTEEVDALFIPRSLTFGEGRLREQCFDITIVRDGRFERPENFFVDLSSTSNGVQLTLATLTVVIIDNEFDRPAVSFVERVQTVNENTTAVESCVSFDARGLAIDSVKPVVRLNTMPQTATAPSDFLNTSTLLTFERDNQVECALIPIVNDDIAEREETFRMFFSRGDPELRFGGGFGSQAVVTIVDDDDADCGPLSSPLNGSVSVAGTDFDSLVTYTCDAGFERNGPSERLCLGNGEWSEEEPTCEIVDCGVPPTPFNGSVDFTETTFGSQASYSCEDTLTLVRGDSVRTCLATGQWSSDDPLCVDCPVLPNLRNGAVDILRAEATYSCNEGYTLVGSRASTCEPCLAPSCPTSGQWTTSAPTCLLTVRVGFQFESYTVREDEGQVSITILIETVENNEPERGLAIQVSYSSVGTENPASSLEYREPLLFADSFGDVRFSSRDKNLTFAPIIRNDLSFEGTEEFLIQISSPRNGPSDIGLETTILHTTSVFIIDDDRVTIGFQNREHLVSEDEGSVDVCVILSGVSLATTIELSVSVEENTARAPSDYAGNSTLDLEVTFSASRASVMCVSVPIVDDNIPEREESFALTLALKSQSQHLAPGVALSPNSTTVVIRDNDECDSLPDIMNGQVLFNVSGRHLDSEATYLCDTGHNLVNGSTVRVCLASREWFGTEPQCETVTCDPNVLTPPVNGSLFVGGITFHSRAIYSCDEGFAVRNGDSSRTCEAEGEWNGTEPTCQAVDCGQLLPPMNGVVLVNGTGLNSVATYECIEGFELSEQLGVRTCLSNEEWSGSEPVCQAVNCGDLSSPSNGNVTVSGQSGATFTSEATYICFEGFQLIGNGTRVCQANGAWSGNEPQCGVVDCGILTHPANGRVSLNQTTFMSEAEYTCDGGVQLVGGSTRVCEGTGLWSGEEPVCEEEVSSSPRTTSTTMTAAMTTTDSAVPFMSTSLLTCLVTIISTYTVAVL